VDNSADGGGTPFTAGLNFEVGPAAGGLEVASFEELIGSEASAASRSSLWSAQNCRYRLVILSKYSFCVG
jgi:hypothetical protein